MRAHVAAAYAAARAKPDNPDARLRLVEALIDTPRTDLAIRHVQRFSAGVPVGWSGATRLGEALFQLGDFNGARRLLAACLEHGQVNDAALRTLSAICHRLGEHKLAARHLATSAWLRPISMPARTDPMRPDVLRTRSFEGSFYASKKKKGTRIYRRWLKNGHFSLKHLLPDSWFNMAVANIHGTNLSLLDDLPKADLIINTVACPDLMPGALQAVAELTARYPSVPIINDPAKLLRTTRVENATRLGRIDGVHFPRTERVVNDGSRDAMVTRIEALELGYPLILRHEGTQTGDTVEKLDDRAALRKYLGQTPPKQVLNAIQYLDCRGADGFYHKTRCFFIDRVFYPVANLSNDLWQIHSDDRYRVMSGNEATQESERHYLGDPKGYLGARAMAALQGICDAIDLDFFGIDFTQHPDGGIIVFEANAAMRHNFDHADAFPHTRPHLDRVTGAFRRMVNNRLGMASEPSVSLHSPGTAPSRNVSRTLGAGSGGMI